MKKLVIDVVFGLVMVAFGAWIAVGQSNSAVPVWMQNIATNCPGPLPQTQLVAAIDLTNLVNRLRPDEITNLVQILAAKGHICAVKGHNWRGGRPGEGIDEQTGVGFFFSDLHPGVSFRTCKTCGVCQSKSETWK